MAVVTLEIAGSDAIKAIIQGKTRDLGGFTVSRIVPQIGHHAVGPFVFMDHLGPVVMPPGHGIDVRPHPHIGLATVTYLFAGEIEHRDSLGSVQVITPGDVNWMTAGRGIVHSERSRPEWRATGGALHGLQLWVGLPVAHEETAPTFHHHSASSLPVFSVGDVQVKLIAGSAYHHQAPVEVLSPLFYVEAAIQAGSTLQTPAGYTEAAVYVISGQTTIDDDSLAEHQLAILNDRQTARIDAVTTARVVILGGEPLDGPPRQTFWNFVSSDKARIDRAKADWANDRFGRVPGDGERIPLPE